MDLKITHKEEVWQPQGKISVLKPDMFEIYPVYEYQIAEGAEGINSDRFAKCITDKDGDVTGTYTGVYTNGFYDFGSFQATAQEAGLVNPSTTVVITKYLADAETVFDDEETFQMATFAAVKQRGNDPLYLDEGNRWAEVVIGEAPVDLVMEDVQESVRAVDNWCKVTFNTIAGADGYEYLMYTVSGLSKENP